MTRAEIMNHMKNAAGGILFLTFFILAQSLCNMIDEVPLDQPIETVSTHEVIDTEAHLE